MHRFTSLGEGIFVERATITADFTDPLSSVENERASFDLDKQNSTVRVE